jgi:2-polyprenyl-3-methyl-5-hydroxy-6-metoxy-1,4-benzoquinol methylase
VADGGAAARWAELQSGRGIPPEIRARVDWNPWQHEPSWFVPPPVPADTPSRAAGLAMLRPRGAVLDVGCGGGAAAFALAERATELIGVDRQRDMLDVFTATARERGVQARVILGEWPDAAAEAGQADVVVAHHVLHNVVDLPPFLRALTTAARRGPQRPTTPAPCFAKSASRLR